MKKYFCGTTSGRAHLNRGNSPVYRRATKSAPRPTRASILAWTSDGMRLSAILTCAPSSSLPTMKNSPGAGASFCISRRVRPSKAPDSRISMFDSLAPLNAQVVLHDLRQDSPTYRETNVFYMGEDNPILLLIPRLVAHGYRTLGEEGATIIYFTTEHYDPKDPDEKRIPYNDPGVGFEWVTKMR